MGGVLVHIKAFTRQGDVLTYHYALWRALC